MPGSSSILSFGEFELDLERRELRHGGEPVALQSTPLRLLLYLVEHRDRFVPKPELLEALWDANVTDTSLANALSQVRKAVADDGTTQQVIRTQKRHGYRFIAPVEQRVSTAMAETWHAESPFVGRADILERLEAALSSAIGGHGRIVLLAGQPGIGKTRTAEELERKARERGVAIYTGWCDESGIAPPYWPWVRLLRAVIEERPTESLRAELGSAAVTLSRILPELRERWPNLPTPPKVGPDGLRFQLSDSICTLLQRLAAQQPVVLILDDLHRADEATLGVLRFLAHEIAQEPIMVLGTYRDVEVDERHLLSETLAGLARHEGFERIPIEGFSRDEVGELVRRLADREVSPEVVEAIVSRTAGNPLFVTELSRALRTRAESDEQATGLEVPRGLHEVILGRLRELSPTCREILAVASVLGRDIAPELCEAASGLDSVAVDGALDEARRAGLVGDGPSGDPRFAHVLVRDEIYGEIRRGRRVELHRAVAEALVNTFPGQPEERAAAIARHWREAGERLEAARWFDRARSPLYAKSPREAYRCCLEGLEVLDGLTDLTAAEVEQASKLVFHFAAWALVFGGHDIGISRAEAEDLLERAREAIGGPPLGSLASDPAVARRMVGAHVAYSDAAALWDDGESILHAHHACALSNQSGDEGARLQAVVTLVVRLHFLAHYEDAYEVARREIDCPPSNPLASYEGGVQFPRILSYGGGALAFCGKPREALGHLEDAIRLLRKDGRSVPPEEVELRGPRASYHGAGMELRECVFGAVACYYFLGEAETASKCARILAPAVSADSPRMQSFANYRLGLTLHLQRRWEELARVADRIATLLGDMRLVPLLKPEARAWGAEARAHLEERKEAVDEVASLLAEESLQWCPGALASCARTLIYCEGAQGYEEVTSVLERLESTIDRTGGRSYTPFLHELRAQLARACGDEETCEDERREAERLWTAMGAHGHIERMARELEELPIVH